LSMEIFDVENEVEDAGPLTWIVFPEMIFPHPINLCNQNQQ
jgi:hypothetical protein